MYYYHFSTEEYDAESCWTLYTANGKPEIQTIASSSGWAQEGADKALKFESSSGLLGFQQCYHSIKCQIYQYQHLISLREQVVLQIL